jgi:hypothetical protein
MGLTTEECIQYTTFGFSPHVFPIALQHCLKAMWSSASCDQYGCSSRPWWTCGLDRLCDNCVKDFVWLLLGSGSSIEDVESPGMIDELCDNESYPSYHLRMLAVIEDAFRDPCVPSLLFIFSHRLVQFLLHVFIYCRLRDHNRTFWFWENSTSKKNQTRKHFHLHSFNYPRKNNFCCLDA